MTPKPTDSSASRRWPSRTLFALLLIFTGLTGCDGLASQSVEVTGDFYSDESLEAQAAAEALRAESPIATLDDVRAAALAYTQFWVADLDGDGPADAEELAPYLKNLPRVQDLIRKGDLVVLWHAVLKDMPSGAQTTVLAYGRDTPVKGGPVAFADTSCRLVDANEFAKLPRASIEH